MIGRFLTDVCHGGWPLPWRTILLTAVAVSLYLLAGPAPEAWVYDRQAIIRAEYWRLLTAHLVHSDGQHALWDIAALVLLGGVFEHRLRAGFWWSLLISLLAIDAWLWLGSAELMRYCGLSGVLNGLLAAGLWMLWRERNDPLVLLVAIGAVGKIMLESLSGQSIFTDTLWPSLPEAHGVGFIAGWLYVVLPAWKTSDRFGFRRV